MDQNPGTKYVTMDFMATPNTPWRFKTPQKPAANITGRYSVPFGKAPKQDMTVGEFKQVGSKLTGTFLSTTGDYRYLEGVVTGNDVYLSCFDGGHDYLFTAKIAGNRLVNGKFYANLSSIDDWSGTKNPNAKLPDAYSLTSLKPGYKNWLSHLKMLMVKRYRLATPVIKTKWLLYRS
ncbi:hypothetical protein HK413_06655 [Mucilaginibacter sp. S1162]|uniref:Uncharacterized protein n=1 Tax=Mucilaginibacter humi TaxID=2732510 RepID=A0ABX1W4H2_9SPHI|nr:hypothetical protein [Mucilaginibacter humi]NNU33905.1 hypothetical protein [Mucilaginibacter humi]